MNKCKAQKRQTRSRSSARKLDSYPRLETVLMVEEQLYKHKSDKTITQIWKLLPEKVTWSIYMTILDYSEHSGKIIVEKDRTVTWLWNPEGIRKMYANPELIFRIN